MVVITALSQILPPMFVHPVTVESPVIIGFEPVPYASKKRLLRLTLIAPLNISPRLNKMWSLAAKLNLLTCLIDCQAVA